MSERVGGVSSLADFLHVARRRRWTIVAAVVVVTAVATVRALEQPKVYAAAAQVLLNRQNVAATYAGVPDALASEDPVRYGATQAFLAESPNVANEAARSVHAAGITGGWLLAHSSVQASKDADLLTFTVWTGDPLLAARLADGYASAFTALRGRLDTSAIRNALRQLRTRVDELRTAGQLRSGTGQALLDREQQLETLAALETSSAVLVRPASLGSKVSPRPKRDALLGLVVGLLLGGGLALLREALDTRVRSSVEIAAKLELPLLGRLAPPPRELSGEHALVMVEQPYSAQGEMFRMLRTNLDLVSIDRGVRTVMITSGLEGEGKTTTAANLAVALAAAGRSVTLVDLDLRRPSVGEYFGLQVSPGLSDVAVGSSTLVDALALVHPSAVEGDGTLNVLTSGVTPPNPAEFLGTTAVAEVLRELVAMCDIVVVDAPPVLHAAEAMTLSTRVDAVVVVTRLNVATRGSLGELRDLLNRTPATKLGFVLTGVESSAVYEYDRYTGNAYAYPDQDLVL